MGISSLHGGSDALSTGEEVLCHLHSYGSRPLQSVLPLGEGPRPAAGFVIQGPEQHSQRCCYSEVGVGLQEASQGLLCLHSHGYISVLLWLLFPFSSIQVSHGLSNPLAMKNIKSGLSFIPLGSLA